MSQLNTQEVVESVAAQRLLARGMGADCSAECGCARNGTLDAVDVADVSFNQTMGQDPASDGVSEEMGALDAAFRRCASIINDTTN